MASAATQRTRRTKVAAVEQRIESLDLSGGIDQRRSPSLVAANRALLLRNFSLSEPGALLTYPGWLAFSTSSLGGLRPQGGQRVYLATSTFTLAAYNGAVYKPSDAGVWGSSVLSGLSVANQIYIPHDRDLVAVFDGTTVPKKSVDGTTWTPMGISAPTVAPTATAVAGGSLTSGSTYEFSYSYQDDALAFAGNESATVQVAVSGANLTARIGVTASADPQVDTIIVYVRNVTAGESVRRRVTSIANATTTVDVTSWPAGSNATEAPTDHAAPPALSFGVVWKNRWWGVDPTVGNRLRFTQIFLNQAWPALFYLDIPFERGDSITAVIPQGGTLVVCGQSKIFLIIGQTSLDFEVRPSLSVQEGALGPRCVDALENGILHAGAGGVYLFDGASDRLLSYDMDPSWRNLIGGASVADLATIACVYHAPRKEVRFAVPRLSPYGGFGEWVLDLNRTRVSGEPAWTSTDRTIGGYISWNGHEASVGNRGRLFSWSNTTGQLFEEAIGTTANGGDLAAEYSGPVSVTGFHVTRFIQYYIEYQPASGTLVGEAFVNGVSQGADPLDIAGSVLLYGTVPYGSALYGGGETRKQLVQTLPLSAEGTSIQYKFRYSGRSAFRLYSHATDLVPETKARGIS